MESNLPRIPDKQQLLQKMGIAPGDPLTHGESRVLKLMLKGYTANTISTKIYRSPRTVEHCIERLKEKLLCDKKSDLIQKGKELEVIGCL
jgi:DNA-binding NarL/FixJ family response regulator